MSSDRLRPEHSERIVIGSIFARGVDGFDEAKAIIDRADFSQAVFMMIWDAANKLVDAGEAIDVAKVYAMMLQCGTSKELGDNAAVYLLELLEGAGVGADLEYHARVVAEAAKRRNLIFAVNEILRDAESVVSSADESIADAQRKLQEIETERNDVGPVSFADAFKEAIEELNRRTTPGFKTELLATRIEKLDDETAGGFAPGELVIIAARPGRGKTAMLLQMCRSFANDDRRPLLFSLEMRTRENAARILAAESQTNSRVFRGFENPTPEQCSKISEAFKKLLSGPPAWIDDRPETTPARLTATARRYNRKHGTRVVLVDYLQLLRPTNPKDQRNQQVGEAARALKLLARNLGIVVVCAAQLNREIEGRDGTPRLSDLRDSGEIEQHADFVFFLHGDAKTAANKEETISLICGKGRSVPAGYELPLHWNKAKMTFSENIPYGIEP